MVSTEDKGLLFIDGSYGEGGGQLLRSALSLSIILNKPFKIKNIRANRPKPGLQPQHLTCVKACQRISSALVEGDHLDSQELIFIPTKKPENKLYHFQIGTAGSTSLLFQTLLYPLAFSQGGTLLLEGGTHVPYSPSYHYLKEVFLPLAELFGFRASLELERVGFYPRGGGKIRAKVWPIKEIKVPKLSPGFRVERLKILSLISEELPEHIMVRQANSALQILKENNLEGEVYFEKVKSSSPGTELLIVAINGLKRAGFSSLGKKGLPAEEVGRNTSHMLLKFLETSAQFEEHLGDQLLLPASLCLLQGKDKSFQYSVSKITKHLLTQAWLISQFLENIKITIEEPGRVLIERR
ncbi:MAG: RNA 3'-terminal phosphate cyclase [Caldimicrobium sp.]|nr:RNA 3'-terminal phosphate cyclase [Caldimicrobium sp.]MCX7873723.1 RNA 3'-terminal phosphate cyclase [Caldimicrobium sp.]MDW8093647.1 RNA 3'-terminal phosphate cyclase [Caldimicrobium sp.]